MKFKSQWFKEYTEKETFRACFYFPPFFPYLEVSTYLLLHMNVLIHSSSYGHTCVTGKSLYFPV